MNRETYSVIPMLSTKGAETEAEAEAFPCPSQAQEKVLLWYKRKHMSMLRDIEEETMENMETIIDDYHWKDGRLYFTVTVPESEPDLTPAELAHVHRDIAEILGCPGNPGNPGLVWRSQLYLIIGQDPRAEHTGLEYGEC